MPRCAFLTIADTKGWFIDDDLVHPLLQNMGWEVNNIPWNIPTVWDDYDIVIVRSTWDYQNNLTHFLRVLEAIDQSSAILLNSLKIIRWGLDKNYFFDLKRKGIELVPTVKKQKFKNEDIQESFHAFSTNELIIKPVLGANAYDTFRISNYGDLDLDEIKTVFRNRTLLIQPFMQSVIDEGEYSLMYFNGHYSHTILKTVKNGDFRVQQEHGGNVIPIDRPEKLLITTADDIMNAVPETPFYARVDMVRTALNTFALMELEVVEPSLYFKYGNGSEKVFAHCIDHFWKRCRTDDQ